jgi:hypothetical protein
MKLIRFSIIALSFAGLFFTSCKKSCPSMITVDAGPSHTVQLPIDTVTLTGTVKTGQTASMSYLWTLISGPNAPTIVTNTSSTTLVSSLVAGTYVFQFQATNSEGNTAVDTTSVIVLPTIPVTVDAGRDTSIQLPLNIDTLIGTVKTGLTSNMLYSWILISGPNTAIIVNSTSSTTPVNNLIAGTYVFQFQATNSYGNTAVDTTSIVVLPIAIKTIVLQPNDNLYEGDINLFAPGSWISDDQIYAEAWTDGGAPYIARACLKFDYSSIPSNAIIDSATLFLYSDPNPINGDKINAQAGPANACYIERITSNWVLPNPFTWNSPPTATSSDEAVIPQSTSATENVAISVTALVSDMQTYGNNGFFIILQNEQVYNTRQFASSFASDPTIHPKLVITYH